jgi:hypothetical protein
MRTTVNLDPDAYSFASAYADAKGISISRAVNEFIHSAERNPPNAIAIPGRLQRNDLGLLEIASTGHVITSEMVKAASEDELL